MHMLLGQCFMSISIEIKRIPLKFVKSIIINFFVALFAIFYCIVDTVALEFDKKKDFLGVSFVKLPYLCITNTPTVA